MISPKVILLCVCIIHYTTSHPLLEAYRLLANDSNLGIIGGHNVSIEDAPFMASLMITVSNNIHYKCGGSIIHEQIILTAAHCCIDYEKVEVSVGTIEYFKGGQVYTAADVIMHELFYDDLQFYDICLIKLNETLTFGPTIGKIDLADDKVQLDDGAEMNALGWGRTEMNNSKSSIKYLQEVTVPFVLKCQEHTFYEITPMMMCAGTMNTSVYYGDSGGPLTLNNTIQVGISSFFLRPFRGISAFTKVASLLPWIKDTMKELLYN